MYLVTAAAVSVTAAVCGVKTVEKQLVERENHLHKLTQIKDTILQSCHPNALPIIKQSFAVLEASWHRVSHALSSQFISRLYVISFLTKITISPSFDNF